jgi:hypothetical protein
MMKQKLWRGVYIFVNIPSLLGGISAVVFLGWEVYEGEWENMKKEKEKIKEKVRWKGSNLRKRGKKKTMKGTEE